MLMELAKIKFLDENHKIRVYGVIQSFKPDLRFVFKRDAILCIKPRNINLCSRTIICTIEIESLIFTMVWICIVIQAFKVSTVKYHAIIRTSVKIPDDFSRFQIRRRQSFVIAIPEMFTIAKQIAAADASIVALLVAGVFYYVFNVVVAFVMARLERRYNYYSN